MVGSKWYHKRWEEEVRRAGLGQPCEMKAGEAGAATQIPPGKCKEGRRGTCSCLQYSHKSSRAEGKHRHHQLQFTAAVPKCVSCHHFHEYRRCLKITRKKVCLHCLR